MTRKVLEVISKRKGFFVIDLGFLNLTVNHQLTDCDLGYFGPGYKTLVDTHTMDITVKAMPL